MPALWAGVKLGHFGPPSRLDTEMRPGWGVSTGSIPYPAVALGCRYRQPVPLLFERRRQVGAVP
jgi:hypothetical protein